jgi:hypothetical protein
MRPYPVRYYVGKFLFYLMIDAGNLISGIGLWITCKSCYRISLRRRCPFCRGHVNECPLFKEDA